MSKSTPLTLPLWADGEIDVSAWTPPEEFTHLPDGLPVVRNVSRPSLTVYLPDPAAATGAAVIVAPGGAYHFHAIEHEGTQVAEWLTARGIAALVLKYRLIETGDDFPQCIGDNLNSPARRAALFGPLYGQIVADGCRAVRLARENAAAWGLDPAKIGIMGFSAGGSVTLSTALHYPDAESRPAFAAPIYSAPPLDGPVPADAPPLFLLCAADDDMASDVSTRTYAEWRAAKRPVELHIYAAGGHGFGMRQQGLPCDHWIERFADWLARL